MTARPHPSLQRTTCHLPLRFLALSYVQREATVTNPMTLQQPVQMTGQMWNYMGLCFLNVKQAPAGHFSIKPSQRKAH